MTAIYETSGKLTTPVSDVAAAEAYLTSDDMTEYFGNWGDEVALKDVVLDINWLLTGDETWAVQVFTNRPLTEQEATIVSEWIRGQNSDGLGEGFEQQTFAEHFETYDWGDDTYEMSSFDWETNPCTLERVK